MSKDGDSILSKILVPVIVAVLIAIVAGGTAPWWIKILFDGGIGPTPTPGPVPSASSVPTPTGPVPSTEPTSEPMGGCVIEISFSFARLRERPAHDSTQIGDAPKGSYEASNTEVVDWASLSQRWFEITALGRTGWLVDDGIQIDSKSADCP
jgi:hypothetical protein